jgi:predicted metalloprotease
MMRQAAAAPRRLLRPGAVAAVVAVSIAATLGAFAWSRWARGPDLPGPLPVERAETVARSLGVAFQDSQATWQRSLGALGGPVYTPAELQFFTHSRTSPCAGTVLATGPFYCRLTREAAFDLAFLDELGLRLRRDAELGWTLVAARIAAAHAQGELGLTDRARAASRTAGRRGRAAIDRALALQADCLTGVWVASTSPPLPVRPGFYYELVRIIRNVADDRAKTGPAMPAGLDPFRPGNLHHREAAFATGVATGDPATCPAAYPVEPTGQF